MLLIIKDEKNIKEIVEERKLVYFTEKKSKIEVNENIIFVFNAGDLLDREKSRKFIKEIKSLKKNKLSLEFEYENQKYNGVVVNKDNISIDDTYYKDIDAAITAIGMQNKKERLDFCYDRACQYLDDEFTKYNYCDFKNDVCIAKRGCIPEQTMGCCHRFPHSLILSSKKEDCKYLQAKGCSTKCFACKLFTCDAIKTKHRIKDVLIADCFFNIPQKIILRVSILTPKEKIMKRLLIF